MDQLIVRIREGDKSAIARGISLAEGAGKDLKKELLRKLYPHTGKSQVVGITGPPGIGKSTLIGNLSSLLAESGNKVSILAIDASSPYTGGSLLGNRIRMQESLWKSGIYMRSLANRGYKGGLSDSALGAVSILDASGSDFIIIETVGAGQADLDIMNLADTTVLVLAPGLGDQIQAIKAGIMEIADIFVINKMDREGSYFAMKDIEETLSLDERRKFKREVVGATNTNLESYRELLEAINRHRDFLKGEDQMGKKRLEYGLKWVLETELREKIIEPIVRSFHENSLLEDSKTNFYEKVENLLENIDLTDIIEELTNRTDD
ncbi:MAG: methylmalonyl Co-A mutase-associated GTPase MeaB [Cuniculiplasma sp.]